MRPVIALIILLISSPLFAQPLQFFGQGRVVMTNEAIDGSIMKADTTHASRSMGGYTQLDMGARFRPYHHLRGHVILRVRNRMGIFWGEGTDLYMREVRIEGVAARYIKYELGDLDLRMSPFTLYANEPMPYRSLPGILQIHRDIQQYEQFVIDGHRRLQGLTFFAATEKDAAWQLRCRTFLTLTAPYYHWTGGRTFSGGTIEFLLQDVLNLKVNMIHDLPFPAAINNLDHKNTVTTLQFALKKNLPAKMRIALQGESGMSMYRITTPNNERSSADGGFTFNKLTFEAGRWLELALAYNHVGHNFTSAGAQIPVYQAFLPLRHFPLMDQDGLQRAQRSFDRMVQEDMLTHGLSNGDAPYIPRYDPVFPYGQATPNRTGFFLNGMLKDRRSVAELYWQTYHGREVKAVQPGPKRQFNFYLVEANMALHKLIGTSRNIRFTTALNRQVSERPTRPFEHPYYTRNTFFTLGTDVQLHKGLHLLTGYTLLSTRGNAHTYLRDIYRNSFLIGNAPWDDKERLVALGLQYRFSARSFITAHLYFNGTSDKYSRAQVMDIRQLYLNFTTSL